MRFFSSTVLYCYLVGQVPPALVSALRSAGTMAGRSERLLHSPAGAGEHVGTSAHCAADQNRLSDKLATINRRRDEFR